MTPSHPVGSTLKRAAKYAGLCLIGLLVAGALSIFLVVRHYQSKLPDIEQLKRGYQPAQVTRVLARDGTLLGSIFTERRTVVKFEDVPGHVKLAFLAAEDASFYEHEGLDYFGMLRAMVANFRAGSTRQGASTITQQVVKNLLLSPERTYERKIKETILASRLERELGKDEILWLYLNHIYLGHGRYGVEEASRHYFAKSARGLDLSEAALLAGLAAAPERFSPRVDGKRALGRRSYVLRQMLEKGFVTRELFEEANRAPIRLAPNSEEESELAPEIVSYARKLLERTLGEQGLRGGFTIHTTLDPRLQSAARSAVRQGLASYLSRQKLEAPLTAQSRKLWGPPFSGQPKANKIYVGRVVAVDDKSQTLDLRVGDRLGRVQLSHEERYNPKHLAASQFSKVGAVLRVSFGDSAAHTPDPVPLRLELGPEAALVAIDPRTREVLALVGNHEALAGGLDRATQARRQPGSAFKPFVYGYALASRRFTPATVLELPSHSKRPSPSTAGETRQIPVRLAFAKSDNRAAQFLLEAAGGPNVVEWARALGIESPMQPTPSLALGAYEVTPLEITNAYTSIACGGIYDSPKIVSRIVGPDGQQVPLPETPPKRQVISHEEAYLITSLMRSVVELGTGRRAASLRRPVAGKTGTTNRAKDAWFIGFSTELVAATWIGYDDAHPLGSGESGAATALPVWIEFMKAAHEGRPVTDFPRPGAIVTASIDPASGLLAYPGQTDALEEEFLDGTVPNEMAVPQDAVPGTLGELGEGKPVEGEPSSAADGTAPRGQAAWPSDDPESQTDASADPGSELDLRASPEPASRRGRLPDLPPF